MPYGFSFKTARAQSSVCSSFTDSLVAGDGETVLDQHGLDEHADGIKESARNLGGGVHDFTSCLGARGNPLARGYRHGAVAHR